MMRQEHKKSGKIKSWQEVKIDLSCGFMELKSHRNKTL